MSACRSFVRVVAARASPATPRSFSTSTFQNRSLLPGFLRSTLSVSTSSSASSLVPHRFLVSSCSRSISSSSTPSFSSSSSSSSSSSFPPSSSPSPSPSFSSTALSGGQSLVVTTAGPDRSGIVHDLSVELEKHGANIEESRMTILGNDFAIIMMVTVPAEVTHTALVTKLQTVFPEFTIGARKTNGELQPAFPQPVRILQINMEGPDQPGVVKHLTSIFVRNNISVRDLDTDTSSAPFAGYKIFTLKCVIAVPTKVNIEAFLKQLQVVEEQYGFDIDISDAQTNVEGEPEREEKKEKPQPPAQAKGAKEAKKTKK